MDRYRATERERKKINNNIQNLDQTASRLQYYYERKLLFFIGLGIILQLILTAVAAATAKISPRIGFSQSVSNDPSGKERLFYFFFFHNFFLLNPNIDIRLSCQCFDAWPSIIFGAGRNNYNFCEEAEVEFDNRDVGKRQIL